MIQSTDRRWLRIDRYIDSNQSAAARAALESLLARDPGDTRAHLTLGALYAAADRPRAATREALLAARGAPADAGVLLQVISALIKVGEMVEARRLLARPEIADSRSVDVLAQAAIHQQLIGDHRAALALVRRAGSAGADGPAFYFYRATQRRFNGDSEGARADFTKCIALAPRMGHAWVQLVHLGSQAGEGNPLDAIEAALREVERGSEDDAALEFARYKVLEDLGRSGQAWQALARANAVMRARTPYDAARETASFDRVIDTCNPALLRRAAAQVSAGPLPIFVIGMPRSGTTVLERLLGNHSMVESAGELGDFPRALVQATDHQPRTMLDEVTLQRIADVDWAEVGETYLFQTRWRARGKPFFVDKLPRNWMVAGLIPLAIPGARILHVVRDPMDTCFSNWRAYLGGGPEFAYAYDLAGIAAHHHAYRKVMAHWHAASPGTILDVDHARLVRDPEGVAREVMAFCGLAFEPGCSDLARNTSPCATLSTAQVRRPISAHAAHAWQPYASQLAGLSDALADATRAAPPGEAGS